MPRRSRLAVIVARIPQTVRRVSDLSLGFGLKFQPLDIPPMFFSSSILFLSTILFLSIISLTLHEIESCTYKLVMVFVEN